MLCDHHTISWHSGGFCVKVLKKQLRKVLRTHIFFVRFALVSTGDLGDARVQTF